jgi:methionine-rich copper-binding protein CopC
LRKLLPLLTLVCSALIASPAWAHSALVFASPGPNQETTLGAHRVKLAFSLPFLKIGDQYEAGIQIKGPRGLTLQSECSSIEVKAMQGIFDFTEPGEYELTWRVVANDGHIVSSAYRFQVLDEEADQPDAVSACAELGLAVYENPLKETNKKHFSEPIAGTAVLQFVAIVGVCLLLSVLVYLFVRRRKRSNNQA